MFRVNSYIKTSRNGRTVEAVNDSKTNTIFGSSYVRKKMLRIGLISPYSLTIPGGVQAQVLGLARELRKMDHGCCSQPPRRNRHR